MGFNYGGKVDSSRFLIYELWTTKFVTNAKNVTP